MTEEAKGRLMVRELVLVLMLNMDPAVPVATLVKTLLERVIWVEVPINTLCPPTMESPAPTVKLPSVVVPIPPLVIAKGLVRVGEVKLGLAETAIVLVPVIAMLEPAVNRLPMLAKVGALLPLLCNTWNAVPAEVKPKAEPVP